MRIIIVEDETNIREGMAALIENETSHTVIAEAENGKEGLSKTLRLKPDLVITDIRMPKMDGLEMVKLLREEAYTGHIIILSGFSEFQYAQKAITYGVDDYMLKPLTADVVVSMLDKVYKALKKEWRQSRGTPSHYLSEFISEEAEDMNEAAVQELLGCNTRGAYVLLVGYIGAMAGEYRDMLEECTVDFQAFFPNVGLCSCYHGSTRLTYWLLSGSKADLGEGIGWLYKRLIRKYENRIQHPLWAYEYLPDVTQLHATSVILQKYLHYGITAAGYCGWYNREWIEGQKWMTYNIPSRKMQNLKNSLYGNDMEGAQRCAEGLLDYYKNHNFQPGQLQQGIIKIYYIIIDVLEEINKDMCRKMQTANILQQFNAAMTWNELEMGYIEMVKILASGKESRKENISNYTIRRAIAYIDEHYNEKIVQKDVAAYLEITPEYLSMLFNREMKESFSSYIKDIRINHAKRLLNGTDMKIYEIAQEVGFSDAKYFNRVFKEEVGISPGEFRQL